VRIIIALDIMEGKCVRLTRGDFSTKKIYYEDPLEFSRMIEDHGIKFIHLVDLDGAKNKNVVNYTTLETIAGKTSLKIDFSGGIRSYVDLKKAFESGASQVTIGSVSATSPALFLEWLAEWGQEKIILGADCSNRKIATGGWTDSTDSDIIEFIKDYMLKGVKYTICTDIDKDGTLEGPSLSLYKEIITIRGINLIASGGISSLSHLDELSAIGCEGAIIGKALYEGVLNLKDLSRLC
jgi:phosphoribosylformimino-5-aminoimidazole carboxamide ribotide isomerase